MNIAIILMVIGLMGCTVWLVAKACTAASDPDNSFGQLEFVVSGMVLLSCAITISFFAIAHVLQ